MVSEGGEMEDYYLVYCIYILSILSFSLYFFSIFCLLFLKIPTLSCDTSGVLLSNITTVNLPADAEKHLKYSL